MRFYRLYHAFTICMLALAASLSSCDHKDSQPQPVIRLDEILAGYASLDYDKQIAVLDSFRPEIDAMFAVLGRYDVDPTLLDAWSTSDVVKVFQPDVDSVFCDTRELESQIGHIVDRAKTETLALPELRYATVTWGNPRPLVRVDSVFLIALNHYLGADYPGYMQWPEFRRTEKVAARLPYDISAALVATQYPMVESSETTLLSWMLYEGALVEARMRLVAGAKEYLAIGLSPDQLKFLDSNREKVWQEMAIKKLIYSTDPSVIDRYMTAAPSTPLLQSQTPGRVGRYIGYMIVRSYLSSHPGTLLKDLLSEAFYNSQQSLIDSGFNGR